MLLFAPEYPRCSEKRATLRFSRGSAPWPLRRRTFWRLVPGSRGRVCSADPRLSRPGKPRPFAKSHSGSCRRAWLEGWSDCEAGAKRRCTVRALGFVDDEALAVLYNGADALVFPSSYEGFGIPVLEPRACGTRVVTTDLPELREAGGDDAIYVPPTSHALQFDELNPCGNPSSRLRA